MPILGRRLWYTCLAAIAIIVSPAVASPAERVAGPVTAAVMRVIDGDTIAVRAIVWLGLEVTVNVRIRGIDAPETRSRCRQEAMLAAAATDRLADAVGTEVRLTDIENDKYAGRVLADVATVAGENIGRLMIASGLARTYDGGARAPWCGVASLGD